jgi:hypothetical protein
MQKEIKNKIELLSNLLYCTQSWNDYIHVATSIDDEAYQDLIDDLICESSMQTPYVRVFKDANEVVTHEFNIPLIEEVWSNSDVTKKRLQNFFNPNIWPKYFINNFSDAHDGILDDSPELFNTIEEVINWYKDVYTDINSLSCINSCDEEYIPGLNILDINLSNYNYELTEELEKKISEAGFPELFLKKYNKKTILIKIIISWLLKEDNLFNDEEANIYNIYEKEDGEGTQRLELFPFLLESSDNVSELQEEIDIEDGGSSDGAREGLQYYVSDIGVIFYNDNEDNNYKDYIGYPAWVYDEIEESVIHFDLPGSDFMANISGEKIEPLEKTKVNPYIWNQFQYALIYYLNEEIGISFEIPNSWLELHSWLEDCEDNR